MFLFFWASPTNDELLMTAPKTHPPIDNDYVMMMLLWFTSIACCKLRCVRRQKTQLYAINWDVAVTTLSQDASLYYWCGLCALFYATNTPTPYRINCEWIDSLGEEWNGAGHITLLCALLHNTLAYSPTGSGHTLLRSPNAMRCAQRKQRNVFIYVVQARDWRLMGLLRALAQRMFWPKKVFCFSSLAVFVQRSHKKCTAHASYTYHPFFVLLSFFCVSFSIAQQ